MSSCCNLLYTSPCSLGCSLLLWRRVRKRQASFDFSSFIFDMFSNKPRQKSGVTLFCLRVSTAEDVWADCKKSGMFPPFVWETYFPLKGGALEQARGLEQASKRPNGRSCRDETWIVYQGFNDCRVQTLRNTVENNQDRDRQTWQKLFWKVLLAFYCSVTLRWRNVTQASSRIVFKRRICESGKTKEWSPCELQSWPSAQVQSDIFNVDVAMWSCEVCNK